ncbi:MAG: TIGR04282 family arsenosugar biosynthesis glycosyltransferase [Vicinamibacterales bacterium]
MVDVAHADVVAILTRAPSSGGKSRLFAELGLAPDPALLTALLLDTVEGAWRPASAGLTVAITPSSACAEVAALIPHARVIPQPDGDLGERMRGVMEQCFAAGAQRVALIGSDLAELTPDVAASAFAALNATPSALVLGPARDGGYYLIAASRVPPVFSCIEWGSADVLARTRTLAEASGWPVVLLSQLGDVDTARDLGRVRITRPQSRTASWVRERLSGIKGRNEVP